jgi:hypothetical protein
MSTLQMDECLVSLISKPVIFSNILTVIIFIRGMYTCTCVYIFGGYIFLRMLVSYHPLDVRYRPFIDNLIMIT